VDTTHQEKLASFMQTRKDLGGISKAMVYRLIDAKKLRRVHIGRRAFITNSSIQAYIAELTEAAS
jgi:predicted DNA-binding transcriptional regulator AlpA